MEPTGIHVAFAGSRQVARGPLGDVLPVLKQAFDRDPNQVPLAFEVETGRQVDFDLRGTLAEVVERVAPARPRGRGRPRLGVVSREVSLLPRHWDWLDQSGGISSAIRRLVEQASKAPGRERARRIRAALGGFLSAMAGDRPQYEEACRALYAGDRTRFAALTEGWPADIRTFAMERADAAARVDETPAASAVAVVADLHRQVWSEGDRAAIERLVAPRYTIHSDPGDPWEGQTLDRAAYAERVAYSRTAFPDLVFTIDDAIAAGDRVAVRWHAQGTQLGDLPGVPATGKRLGFAGQTVYAIEGGQVAGHWQVVDRLSFLGQLR